jgi:hypothetical protein
MLNVGDRVRLKADAPLLRHHPALAGAVGTVGRVVKGSQWGRLTSSPAERAADVAVNVHFKAPANLVVLNVEVEQLELSAAPRR